MPEYLAPGVFVEETSFRSNVIEGVSTTTTGFIGPARFGPVKEVPDLLTSLADYELTYGDGQGLTFSDGGELDLDNYTWHGVRAFFTEGGKRLYLSRTFRRRDGTVYTGPDAAWPSALPTSSNDGHARGTIGDATGLRVQARFPGAGGNLRVRVTVRVGQNLLTKVAGRNTANGLLDGDIVVLRDMTSPIDSPPGTRGGLYKAVFDHDKLAWSFTASGQTWKLADLDPTGWVRRVTLTVTVLYPNGHTVVWDGLAPEPGHMRNGVDDSIWGTFADPLANKSLANTIPIVITSGTSAGDGLSALSVIAGKLPPSSPPRSLLDLLSDAKSADSARSAEVLLSGGNDGLRPTIAEYEGTADETDNYKTGLKQFEDLEDISIVAAPGSTYLYENAGYQPTAQSIIQELIAHAEKMRYRIAVIDCGDAQSLSAVRAMRGRIDSKYAAFYYPWVRIMDPVTQQQIHLPPSGFVAGIYARNDVNRAVYKAPANEVVNLALGFQLQVNKAQQEVLNPEGINCFRFFEGRGNRLWGARTATSDPEWKYVSIRRYFAYLERSVDKGTQWVVFEPNGEALWANVRRTIEDFLLNEWQSGALLGDKPEKAYFVRCDRSTMTQNDLDNGRLVCLIGVAVVKPAEFVIFRIGQWTGDRKV